MGYQKKPKAEWKEIPLRKNFDVAGGVVCKGCFEKKVEIDRLRDENTRLKAKLKYDSEKSGQLPVGAHTPPSRIDKKKNSTEDLRKKKGGAKIGHPGHGRSSHEKADETIQSECDLDNCPDCGGALHSLGSRNRSVVEAMPIKAKQVLYTIHRYRCTTCSKVVESKPDVLPKCLYGARLLSQASVMHYFHGISIGKLMAMNCSHLGIRRIQQIFSEKEKRMYQWVKDRRVPADNNKAERELRPTVIARKISLGSQSDAGAKTRGAIMTILFTAKKRIHSELALEDWLKQAIERLAKEPNLNIYNLLPTERAPNPTRN